MNLRDLVQSISGDAQRYAQTVADNTIIEVKTNLGPAFTLGGASSTDANGNATGNAQPGVLDAIGFKFSVTARLPNGSVIAHYGDPPATDPLLAGILVTAALGVTYLIFRGVRSFF